MQDVSGTPYLTAPAGSGLRAVAAIQAARDCLRVGIVWSGSTTFGLNHERRVPLRAFVAAFARPGVQMFSLRKGLPAAELWEMPNAPVIDLAPMLLDFADTAAAVVALDLVIMTDSAVAHLAGAMGTPVWVLANFGAYWLWHADRDDSPWYDSLRLFRARTWNDWAGVFAAASVALGGLVAGHCANIAARSDIHLLQPDRFLDHRTDSGRASAARFDPPPEIVRDRKNLGPGPGMSWLEADQTLAKMRRNLTIVIARKRESVDVRGAGSATARSCVADHNGYGWGSPVKHREGFVWQA